MELNKIHQGDCIEVMKLMSSNSVDCIVTDPPYELGFMGKKWDGTGIANNIEMWSECLRILKPGGHLLSFGGTRTYHRMACAIEDAGFEIRDQIQWIYGCLSEDTEVLTLNGWERYHKFKTFIKNKESIMIYDVNNKIYKWEKPERWQEYYINEDTCYRIKSDSTDQIVSKNHNCLVERKGKLTFVKSETLKDMERMPTLSNDFFKLDEEKPKILFKTMQWLLQRTRMEKMGNGRCDKIKFKTSFKRQQRSKKSRLERRSNLLSKKGKLWEIQNKIYSLSKELFVYGKKGWICNGTPFVNGKKIKQMFKKNRSSSSHRPQSREQQNRKFNIVQEQQGAQDTRGYRITKAKVTKEIYSGLIFCPTVSTGCFVARRNGKIFLTGNSGFPKSHNIGKAVDKTKGVERKKVKDYHPRNPKSIKSGHNIEGGDRPWLKKAREVGYHEIDSDIPVTNEAKKWNGWGTGLKPANEPIVLARKPLSEKTVALNVLKWGTGGINIDGCRVGTEIHKVNINDFSNIHSNKYASGAKIETKGYREQQGRFPANVIFDEEAGEMLDEQSGDVGAFAPVKKANRSNNVYGKYDYFGDNGKSFRNDKGGASRFFKNIPKENIYKYCNLCYNTLHKANEREWKNINVNNVEQGSGTIQAINESSVRKIVMGIQKEKLAQIVKSVENLCDLCVTDFVQSLVVISESQKDSLSQKELQAIQDFIGNYKKCILFQNLVNYVVKWENIDTTQITKNLLKLFGSVRSAIDNYIKKDTKVQAELKLEPKRFLYQAKASKAERNKGCEGLEEKEKSGSYQFRVDGSLDGKPTQAKANNHPTVKPIKLMKYLIKLVCPPNGVVLDPFTGSGTTLIAAKELGFNFVGIEKEEEYIKIAEARLKSHLKQNIKEWI